MADAELKKQFEYFKAHQDELVEKHEGKFVVIADEKVLGAYETELQAYAEAQKMRALGTFLIQRCVPGAEAYTQTFHSRVAIH